MTKSIDDILRGFSEVRGTESAKLDWLRERLDGFFEELTMEIEGKMVQEPTFVGRYYNTALKEAAAIVRTKADSR